MWKLFESVRDLLWSWWRVDRPRISPREGCLLRIAPPAILRIGSRLLEVVSRTVGENSAGPFVAYECRCGEEVSELWVAPVSHCHTTAVRWLHAGRDELLDEDEVEVYPTRRSHRSP
jgi:hypothetical protein